MREGSIRFLGFMCVRFFPSEAGLLGWTLKTSTFSNCMQVWMKMLKRSGLGQACCVHRGQCRITEESAWCCGEGGVPEAKGLMDQTITLWQNPITWHIGQWSKRSTGQWCACLHLQARWHAGPLANGEHAPGGTVRSCWHCHFDSFWEWMIWRVCLQRSTRNMQYAVVKLGYTAIDADSENSYSLDSWLVRLKINRYRLGTQSRNFGNRFKAFFFFLDLNKPFKVTYSPERPDNAARKLQWPCLTPNAKIDSWSYRQKETPMDHVILISSCSWVSSCYLP